MFSMKSFRKWLERKSRTIRNTSRKAKDNACHLSVEKLENRLVPSTLNTWLASGSANFNFAGNWSLNHVPQTGEIAEFSANAVGNCSINLATVTCDGIQIDSGYTGTITAGTNNSTINLVATAGFSQSAGNGITNVFQVTGTNVTINDAGNWSLNATGSGVATFTPGTSTVAFNGNSAQLISGSIATTFNNVTINNASGVALGHTENVTSTPTSLLTMQNGTLFMSGNALNVNGITGSSSVNSAPAGTLTVNVASGTDSYPGLISGFVNLTKTGAGTLTLTNTSSTYDGQLAISQGILSVPAVSNIGTASPIGIGQAASTILLGSSSAAELQFTGGSGATNRPITINGAGGATIQSTAAGTLALSGAVNVGTNSLTFDTVNNGVNISESGAISGANPGTINKISSLATSSATSGMLTLSGNSSFSGTINVIAGNAGTLMLAGGSLANATVDISGAGNLLDVSGANSVGTLVATFGGTIEPGSASPGTLTASSANFSIGGTLLLDVPGFGTAGTNYDQLVVTGALTVGGSSTLTLAFHGLLADGKASSAVTFGSISGSDFTTVNTTPANTPAGYVIAPTSGSTATGYNSNSIDVLLDAPLSDTSLTKSANAIEGASTGDVVLATFVSAAVPSAPLSEFTTPPASVIINWGDSTTSTGTVQTHLGGGFEVHGNHVYTQEGGFLVSVNITSAFGSTLSSAKTTIIVADAAPTVAVNTAAVTAPKTGTASDSGTFGDYDDAVTITASQGTVTQNTTAFTTNGTWSWTQGSAHVTSSGTVTITATNSNLTTSTTIFQVTFTEVAPSVAVTGTTSVTTFENVAASNNGTFGDFDEAVTVFASEGTIMQVPGSVTPTTSGSWLWSLLGDETQNGTVTITAINAGLATATTTFSVTFLDVAPTVALSGSPAVSATEGTTAKDSGTFGDYDDAVTLFASQGSIQQTTSFNGVWSWSQVGLDETSTPATVTITIRNSNFPTSPAVTTTFTVIFTDAHPTIAIPSSGTSVSSPENVTASDSGTFGDYDDSPVTLVVTQGTLTLGTFVTANTPGATATWSWTQAPPPIGTNNPNLTQTITLTATNASNPINLTTTSTFTYKFSDLKPTVAVNTSSFTVGENAAAVGGAPAVTNSGSFGDFDDTVTLSSSGSVAGTVTESGSLNGTWTWTQTAAHDEAAAGQTVVITATNAHGSTQTTFFKITFTDVAPSVVVTGPTSLASPENVVATNVGTFGDYDDQVLLSVSQGLIIQSTVFFTTSGTWSWTQQGDETQSGTVTITATNADNNTFTTTFRVTFTDVAPSVAVTPITGTSVAANEGMNAFNSGTFGDYDDPVFLSASIGGIQQNTFAFTTSGSWTWSQFSALAALPATVTITARNADNSISTTTFSVTFTDAAPTVIVNASAVTSPENVSATNTGTFADYNETVTLAASQGAITASSNTNGTWTWTQLGDEVNNGTVTITAKQFDGLTSTTTFSVTFTDVAPSVAVIANGASVSANEGSVATDSGTFGDYDDAVSLSASQGVILPAGTQPFTTSGTWTWTQLGIDETNGATVTITARNAAGSTSTTTFKVTFTDAAPTVAVTPFTGTSISVPENTIASDSGTFGDYDDPVSLTASQGSITQAGFTNSTWSWTQGPAHTTNSGTVTITARNLNGSTSTTTFTLSFTEVAPTVVIFATTSITVKENVTASNTGTFGDYDDPVILTASQGTITQSTGAYTTNGVWTWTELGDETLNGTVTITATNTGLATKTTTFTVVFTDVAPTLTQSTTSISVGENVKATVSGTYGDYDDPVNISVSYSVPQIAPTVTSVSLTQSPGSTTYTTNGVWTWTETSDEQSRFVVTITATNAAGTTTTKTFNMTFTEVAPSIAVTGSSSVVVAENTTASDSGTFGDYDDPVTLSASQGSVVDNGNGTWAWSQPSAAASTATVTITATNHPPGGGNLTKTTTFSVTFTVLAPTVVVNTTSVSVAENLTASNSGSFGDFDETVTLAASQGNIVPTTPTGPGSAIWTWTQSSNQAPSGFVTVTATNAANVTATTTFLVIFSNIAPTVVVFNTNLGTVPENVTASNSGVFGDFNNPVTLTASQGVIQQNGNGVNGGTWTWTQLSSASPQATVVIRATDNQGSFSTTSFLVAFSDVAPTVFVTGPNSVSSPENVTASDTGIFGDYDDRVTITASQGSVVQNTTNFTPSGTWTWSQKGDETQGGIVVITARNANGSTSTTTFSVAFTDVAPTVAVTGSAFVSVLANQTASNNGIFGDYDDTVTLTASQGSIFQNTNAFTTSGTWNWTQTSSVAPTSVVTITATNADGSTSTTTFGVQFTAVAPTVTANVPSVSAVEASTASNAGSFGAFNDTVSLSASQGFISQNGTTSGTWSWSQTSAVPAAASTVTILATSSHGATSTTTFTVTFNDAPLTSSPSDLTPPVATVGIGFSNVTVFTFTDTAANNAVNDYTAVITLGDGNTLTVNSSGNVGSAPAGANGSIVANGGRYSVLLSYTYNTPLTNATFAVKAIDNSNGRLITDPTNSTTSQSVSNFSVTSSETWTGSSSTNWNVAGNWSANFVPTASTNVTITNSPSNQPVLNAASVAFNLTINTGATLNANGNTLTAGGLTTVNGGTYNGSTNTQTFGGGLSLTGASVSGSNLVLGGDVTTNASSSFSSISGNLNLGGARNFNVALGSAGIDLFISAVISNGSLAKLGAGDLTLASANNYSGSTSILGGMLSISADNNLGTPPSFPTPADLVINGGTLQVTLLGAPNPGNLVLNSNRGIAVGPTSGSGSGTIDVTDGDLDYGGVIANNGSGTGGLIKTDLGQITLLGTNTYTGPTALQNGLVVVMANGGLGGAGAAGITVSSGAELNLSSGTAYTIPEALTLNGNGVSNTGQGVFVGNNISWAGSVTLGSNSFVRSTNNTLTFNGPINLAGFQLQINNAALTNNNRTVISGSSTVTGGGSILVSAGTLQVDGNASGIAVNVNSGATLTGRGSVGAITVNAGSTVSPGDPTLPGIGTLNASSANFFGGSKLLVRVTGNTTGGVTNDKLAVSGAMNLFSPTLSLDLTGLSRSGSLTSQSFTVVTANPVSGTFASPVTLAANPNGHSTPTASYTSGSVLVNFTDVGSQWLDGDTSSSPAVEPNIGQAGTQTQNAAPVVVAVLDTGIDATGQTNVLPGWNVVANNSNTTDDNGHGTYIASLVTSVDPNAEILPVKFLDANGQGTTAGAIAAVDYAIDHGAKIVVAAWAVADQSPAWAREVQKAESAGVLMVMAAGNNDQSLLGPLAAVHDNNVVVVGASDGADQLASFSNGDSSVVDLAAPGVNVLGAQVGGGEVAHSGTSVSTALVAGTLALEWGLRPDQSYKQVVAALLTGAEQEPGLAAGVAGGRELNVLGALEADALPAATQVEMLPVSSQPTAPVLAMPTADLQTTEGSSIDAPAQTPVQFVQQQSPAAIDVGMTSNVASKTAMFGGNLSFISAEATPIAGSNLAEAFSSDAGLPWLTTFDRVALAGAQTMSNAQDAWSDSQNWLDVDGDELAKALTSR